VTKRAVGGMEYEDANRASEGDPAGSGRSRNKTDIEKEKGPSHQSVVREVMALVQRELPSHQASLRMEWAPVYPRAWVMAVQYATGDLNMVMKALKHAIGNRRARTGDPIDVRTRNTTSCDG